MSTLYYLTHSSFSTPSQIQRKRSLQIKTNHFVTAYIADTQITQKLEPEKNIVCFM